MPTLDDVLTWENLRNAWDRVADNGGAPGPDAESIGRFARYWGANLHTLRELVRTGHYHAGKLRRVAIPKRDGGKRLLCIPNVGDRVLQRAVLNVLEPHCERFFLPCSHGYRPRRGVHTALAQLLALRDRGFGWVLDADIDDCFPSINHARLRALLAAQIDDARLRATLQRGKGPSRSQTALALQREKSLWRACRGPKRLPCEMKNVPPGYRLEGLASDSGCCRARKSLASRQKRG